MSTKPTTALAVPAGIPEHLAPYAERIQVASAKTLESVQEIGVQLSNARSACRHGEWGPFLEKMQIPTSTAHLWIQVATHLDDKPALERAQFSTVREVIRSIRAESEDSEKSNVGDLPPAPDPAAEGPAAPAPAPGRPASTDDGKRSAAWTKQTEGIAGRASRTPRKTPAAAPAPVTSVTSDAMEAAEAEAGDNVIAYVGVDQIREAAKNVGRPLSREQIESLTSTSRTIVKLVKVNAELSETHAELMAREQALSAEAEDLRNRIAVVGDPEVVKRLDSLTEENRVLKGQRDEFQAKAEKLRRQVAAQKKELSALKKEAKAAPKPAPAAKPRLVKKAEQEAKAAKAEKEALNEPPAAPAEPAKK